ncbi:MAG: hypothetical protein IOC82_08580 [Aestuariivirga sp.]|uniref:hypothetical protein n=1 Tax=Aestuariivirga sp. TaxID=2650926 RepID=UPI0025BCE270|nr:hypothetical protein [Aestuariivirga sp.]MCA3561066.1 hypothetical protein [Aestuariivirga sp.]
MKTILLIAHLIAIATGTGMSIANYINIRIASGETGDRRAALAFLRRILARIGDIVILAIWITGIGLWLNLPPQDGPNSWFIVKMGFVVLLTLCHGLARMTAGKMMRSGDQSLYPRMELLVSGVWISALAAIILAVLAFET